MSSVISDTTPNDSGVNSIYWGWIPILTKKFISNTLSKDIVSKRSKVNGTLYLRKKNN